MCEYLTVTREDISSKARSGVCRECDLKFVQPNFEKWKAGWHPSKKQILEHKEDIKKRIYSILSDINNYI
jgi:hypothetical protein